MNKWSEQLAQLASLGLVHVENYIAILEEEKGNMEKVVDRIIRRES